MKNFVLEAWCWSYGVGIWVYDHSMTLLTLAVLALLLMGSRSTPGAVKTAKKNS
jgi:hypothetical protein